MKKPLGMSSFRKRKKFNVIFLTMKLFTLLLFVGTMAATAANSYSQKTKLDLQMQNATVSDILRTIESNSEFIFIYDASVINANATRSVSVKGEQLENVLEQLFKGTNVAYKIDDRQVLLYKSDNLKTLDPLSASIETQQAQKKAIRGTVKDEKGQPIPGVSVVVKGTTMGQVTDVEGKYALEVPADAKTLVFSFVGMDQQEVIITGRTQIDITMRETILGLGEVVVVGYGTQKKVDLTGALSTVSIKDFQNAPVTDALDAMQGKVAGVTITNNSGNPGDGKEIVIRGIQSWSSGTQPLYVIDGVILSDMSSVAPNDIETITVLKDAASTAVYGSRGANGVVLITTKRGSKTGAPVISFHTYAGVSVNSDLFPKTLNSAQWLMLDRESYVNAGPNTLGQSPYGNQNPADFAGLYTAPAGKGINVNLPAYGGAVGINGYLYNTNWLKTVMQTGKMQNYDVSVSGGNEKSTYYSSATYFKQDGMIINTDYQRISFRLNYDYKVTDFIDFGSSVNIYGTKTDGLGMIGSDGGTTVGANNVYLAALRQNPLSRPYELDANGKPTGYGFNRDYTLEGGNMTPLILAQQYTSNQNYTGFIGNIFAKIKIFDGLTFTPKLSLDYVGGAGQAFTPSINLLHIEGQGINNEQKSQNYNLHWITDYQLNYDKTFNKVHNVSATAIYSQESSKNEYLWGQRYGEVSNIQYLNAGQLDNQQVTNGATDWSFVSYIGRVNYNYNGQYYIQGSVRRDGTSRFTGDNKWGTFPSASAGWRISKESFFQPYTSVVNDLKLRASVGTVGDVQGTGLYPTYATLGTWNTPMGPQSSQSATPTYALSNAVNSNIKWESRKKYDAGLDANLFNSKLTLTADWFKTNTSNLIYGLPLPESAGKLSDPSVNGGGLESHGWDFLASWQDKKGDFTYGVNGNLSIARNKVTDLQGQNLRENGLQVGEPVYSFFGYHSNGIIKNQATLDANPYLTNTANDHQVGIGDIWTVDVNGRDANNNLTGKPDGKITADDRGFIGKKYPDFTYGLSGNVTYKRWTLQIVGYGVQGVDLNTMSDINGYFQYTSNDVVRLLNRWDATNNPNGNMPRVTKVDFAQNSTQTSDFWLSDASFFKINNVNLRYAVPENICKNIRMKGLEIYGSVENLHTFTKYPGGEVDVTDQGMWQQPVTKVPQPRTWVLGLKASF
jgi:TonB-linked SusC/RagA family outer membrane protein